MAVNKNFVVKNGLEVSTDLILADAARNKVGIGSTTPRTELDVRGGIAATDISISGVGTIVTLQSNTGTVTNLSSTNLVAGVATVGAVQATHITATGVTTATTLNVTGTGTIAVGVVTFLSGTNLNYSGIATANSISIGATQVISSGRQLQNIVSLDATTTSTIEAAIANAPNTFTDLRVTGFSTLNAVSVGDITLAGIATGLNVPGISTLGSVQSTTLNVTGISTLGSISATNITLAGIATGLNVPGISTLGSVQSTTLRVTGFSTLSSVSATNITLAGIATGLNVPGISTLGSVQSTTLNVTGVSTLGTLRVSSGIVTATSGIITYYGDGRYLQNVISGVGIGSTGGVVGYGVTFINFYGPGVSTAYYSSTTGIATVYFQGGGGGGASVSIGTVAPVSPTSGDLWYNNEIGRTFIYYDEVYLGIGNAQVWVDTSPFNIGVLNPVSIALSTGTFSSPSLYFSSDSDTGLFQPTPNQQTFVAAGASVLNVNPGGINVTGVVTATSFVGNITGNINSSGVSTFTNGPVLVGSGTSTGTSAQRLQVTGSGYFSANVGIGRTNPSALVHLTGASAIGAILERNTTGESYIRYQNNSGTMHAGISTGATFWGIGDSNNFTNAPYFVVTNTTGAVGIGTTNPAATGSTLGVAGTITELSSGQYWNVVTQADVGIGASQVPLNQYLGQLAFVDEYSPNILLTPRVQSVGEKTTLISGNTVTLTYNTGGGNIAICTNPSGDITLNVVGIPTDSSFDNTSLTFSVFVNQTGTARSCTAVNLNGVSETIRWAGGSLAAAISGVTTTSGFDIYSFTGINTVGSASTAANYVVLGVVNGGYR